MYLSAVLAILLYHAASGAEDGATEIETVGLLEKYGYLPPSKQGTGYLRTPDAVKSALKVFQRYAGLTQSGIVDKETVAKLKAPRCGMSDEKALKRARRYVHQGTSWEKRKLTWKILRYSRSGNRLTDGQIRRTIYDVLAKWSAVTNLDFVETRSDDADIRITFASGFHNDPYQFDGRGGTLAHAFYPLDNKGLSGDAHFDDDEWFTLGSSEGTNFYWVALHEFGHSIGLEHSQKLGAIMYPWYQGYKGDNVPLTNDDIEGIQALYGARKATAATTSPITEGPKPPKPAVCLNRIKAAFLGGDHKVYVFNDDKLYVLGKSLQVERGPLLVSDVFNGVTKVDAAIKNKSTGRLVFFLGDKYWVFNGYSRESGPLPITNYGLTADMRDLDAAFSWKGTNKQYFFKGAKFWRYDEKEGRIDQGYPKHIRLWRGVPSNIDAVFQWRNGAPYFFKGEKFYRFDYRRIAVARSYPKLIRKDFVVCKPPSKPGQLIGAIKSTGEASGGIRATSKFMMVTFIAIFVSIIHYLH